MHKWSTETSDEKRRSETRKFEHVALHCFCKPFAWEVEKIEKNAGVFVQMEDHKHQKIDENGPPEGEKCCRGSKSSVAALGNAGCSFCIEGRVLGL